MTVTLCLSCSLGLLNRRPRGSLCRVICYILSATSQVPKLHWGSWGPPRLSVAFPTTSSPTGLELQLNSHCPCRTRLAATARNSTGNSPRTRTQLSYIIVRCPFDLWNRMFNRHQAEITVMQFTGHSLPEHQSMSVPWEFFSSSHFISLFPPTRFPHITAIGMCHFLPVHHLEWHFAPAEGQNITVFVFVTTFNMTGSVTLDIYLVPYHNT